MWKLDISTDYNMDIYLYAFNFTLQMVVLTRINFFVSQQIWILEITCTVTARAY